MKALLLSLVLLVALSAPAQLVYYGPIIPGDAEFPNPKLVILAEQWPMHWLDLQPTLDPGWSDFLPGPTFHSCYPDGGFVFALFDASYINLFFRSVQTPCLDAAARAEDLVESDVWEMPKELDQWRWREPLSGTVWKPVALPLQYCRTFPFNETFRRGRMVAVTNDE